MSRFPFVIFFCPFSLFPPINKYVTQNQFLGCPDYGTKMYLIGSNSRDPGLCGVPFYYFQVHSDFKKLVPFMGQIGLFKNDLYLIRLCARKEKTLKQFLKKCKYECK